MYLYDVFVNSVRIVSYRDCNIGFEREIVTIELDFIVEKTTFTFKTVYFFD